MKENQHMEFITSWRDEYIKWICDFANAFFRAGLIESWGRGIEKIIDESKAFNATAPMFRLDGGLWIEFPLRYPHIVSGDKLEKTTQKTTQKILAILREHPSSSRREIAEQLGDITEDGVKYHLEKLKGQGTVRRIGPAKGGHWEVLSD